MSTMSSAQLATLAADIVANAAEFGSLPHNSDGAWMIAAAYNAEASPQYYVWRTSVTQDEIMLNGFDWLRVDNLSVGKARIWEWMFNNENRWVNPSKANIRSGIAEAWKGTTADENVRLAVYGHCQRLASRVEKLFATGAGTAATKDAIGPGTMSYEGPMSYDDVKEAMGW